MSKIAPALGQVWRKISSHPERFVHIEAVFDAVFVRTVRPEGGGWEYAPQSQTRTAGKDRFGEHYVFVEKVEPGSIK